MSKNFDETVRLQSEKRQEWIQKIREERLQGIAEGTSSAPHLASSLAASFPGREECPETHCILIVQKREKTILIRSAGGDWDNKKDGAGRARVREQEKK